MARWLRLWVLPTEVWLHCPTRLCIFAITTCASGRAVNIRTSSLKTSFIASLVFFTGIATLSHVQDTKPAPPTPIDEKKVELGGTPWNPQWDQIIEKSREGQRFHRVATQARHDDRRRRSPQFALERQTKPCRNRRPQSVTGPISVEGVSCGCRARTPEKSDSGRRIPSAFQSSKPFD